MAMSCASHGADGDKSISEKRDLASYQGLYPRSMEEMACMEELSSRAYIEG
jgi:hypothetical protein